MIGLNNSNTQVAGSKLNSVKNAESLTYAQKQRYHYLFPIYNNEEIVIDLVTKIQGRGRNSWTEINKKIELLNSGSREQQQYHDALYDNFEVDQVYSSAQIIGIVAEVRRDLGLDPYINRLKKFCEEDFFELFIVDDVFKAVIDGDDAAKVLAGYKPVFKLKPED
jgi:hypothetical protein